MINERSPVIRRSPQRHHYDRLCSKSNPNPSTKLPSKPHGSMDWLGSGEPSLPMSTQPQSACQQNDAGLHLASSNTASFLSHSAPSSSGSALYMVSASREAGGGSNRFNATSSELPSSFATGAAGTLRETYNRTKVVVRHLPPGLSESAFMEEIMTRFSTMYNMVSFCPGTSSIKGGSFSRAYIDFKRPEDVIDFFEGFDGHVFVNERGTQCKALVEYAPNQRVPKLWPKKDQRDNSIFQDKDYIKFKEQISKPIEYLPSAEAQLERKEIERISSSGVKEAIIVTPLMEFVRQKRALKYMPKQKSSTIAGKISTRGGSSSLAKMVMKRGADRSRANSMYTPGSRLKEKTYIPRYEEARRGDSVADKKGRVVLEAKDNKILPENSSRAAPNIQGASALKVSIEQGVGKVSLAGKKNCGGLDKEELINGVAPGNSGSAADGKITTPVGKVRVTVASKSSLGLTKANHCFESDSLQGASSTRASFRLQKAEQQNDLDKRFSRSQVWKTSNREVNSSELESGSTQHFIEDKIDMVRPDGRRLRNKDRPDRPVWTVRQRSEATELLKHSNVALSISPPGNKRHGKGPRDLDNITLPDGSKPPSKRAGSNSVHGGHEKQVWVAKPGSGS